jgi:uncharacterized cupredoxin-like copper-binding protein
MKIGIATTLLLALATPALAHPSAEHDHGDTHHAAPIGETTFGRTGDPRKATRSVTIEMSDTMRFAPAEIRVRQGETIRFLVTNPGKVMHEMVLGTLEELKAVHMEHDGAGMAQVQSGKRAILVWQFSRPGEFYYACLIPGHFEAGMVGKVIVSK